MHNPPHRGGRGPTPRRGPTSRAAPLMSSTLQARVALTNGSWRPEEPPNAVVAVTKQIKRQHPHGPVVCPFMSGRLVLVLINCPIMAGHALP